MTVEIKPTKHGHYDILVMDEHGVVMDTTLSYQGIEDLRYSLTQAWNKVLGLGPKVQGVHECKLGACGVKLDGDNRQESL